jgi:hypothetical protein
MRHTRLYPLNSGVTEVVLEEMLTVGQNLDRTGEREIGSNLFLNDFGG